MNAPSITDLARELGVNKSTVSRALRGDPQINQETAAKITAHAQARGYCRNPTLTALSDLRWRRSTNRAMMNWGFLVTEIALSFPENQHMLEHFKKYAREAGYSLSEIVVTEKTTARELNRMADARNLRGVIVNQIFLPRAAASLRFEEIHTPRTVWIYCGNFFFQPNGPRVVENSFASTITCLEKMKERGYQKIALLYPSFLRESRDVIRQRAAALEFAWRAPNMQIQFKEIDKRSDGLFHYETPQGIDAVLYSGQWTVSPEVVRLPSVCLRIISQTERLSGIVRLGESMAQTAVDSLDFLCRRMSLGLDSRWSTILVEGRWQEGRTLGKAND